MKKNGWILVDEETDKPAKVGCVYNDFSDERWILTGGQPPLREGSTGRVWVERIGDSMSREFFPSVIDMKWKEIK